MLKLFKIEDTDTKIIKTIYYIIIGSISIIALLIMINGLSLIISGKGYINGVINNYSGGDMAEARAIGFKFFFESLITFIIAILSSYVIFGIIFDIKSIRKSIEKKES